MAGNAEYVTTVMEELVEVLPRLRQQQAVFAETQVKHASSHGGGDPAGNRDPDSDRDRTCWNGYRGVHRISLVDCLWICGAPVIVPR